MFERWKTPTARNGLRVSILLWAGAALTAALAPVVTQPTITSVLTLILAWVASAVAFVAGWSWLRRDGDRWHMPFAAAVLTATSAALFAMFTGEPPVATILVLFVGTAAWMAAALERNRVAVWREEQAEKRSTTFSADKIPNDPLIERRESERMDDADSEYPATLRELKARLHKADGDPWS